MKDLKKRLIGLAVLVLGVIGFAYITEQGFLYLFDANTLNIHLILFIGFFSLFSLALGFILIVADYSRLYIPPTYQTRLEDFGRKTG